VVLMWSSAGRVAGRTDSHRYRTQSQDSGGRRRRLMGWLDSVTYLFWDINNRPRDYTPIQRPMSMAVYWGTVDKWHNTALQRRDQRSSFTLHAACQSFVYIIMYGTFTRDVTSSIQRHLVFTEFTSGAAYWLSCY